MFQHFTVSPSLNLRGLVFSHDSHVNHRGHRSYGPLGISCRDRAQRTCKQHGNMPLKTSHDILKNYNFQPENHQKRHPNPEFLNIPQALLCVSLNWATQTIKFLAEKD